MDNLKSAIFKTGHHSGFKAKVLAEAIQIPHQQFLNKVCMTNQESALSVFQAVDVQLATNTRHIHHAMGVLLDEQSIPTRLAEPVDLMSAVLRATTDHGGIISEVQASIEDDGMVDMQELQACIAAISLGIKSLMVLQAAVTEAAKNRTVVIDVQAG